MAHRNSGFSHYTWWIFPLLCDSLPGRVPVEWWQFHTGITWPIPIWDESHIPYRFPSHGEFPIWKMPKISDQTGFFRPLSLAEYHIFGPKSCSWSMVTNGTPVYPRGRTMPHLLPSPTIPSAAWAQLSPRAQSGITKTSGGENAMAM